MRIQRRVRDAAAGACALLVCFQTSALGADVPSASEVLARLKAGNERFAADGAYYELESGRVAFSQPVRAQPLPRATNAEPNR